MATNINTILGWYRTGLKPTETQFRDSWRSFWHKDEKISQSAIDGLTDVLSAKTENSQFNGHKTDANAHSELFAEKVAITDFEEHLTDEKAHAELFNNKIGRKELEDHDEGADAHEELFAEKEDITNKGMADGYAPLDEFSKLAEQYLNIVNDLVTGGATALLSAEQGKVLKGKIDTINLILTSNDVNLDTVQELVDAIKNIELSLGTILVNDLTTGGVSKALTAEMGKVLQANKADKTMLAEFITRQHLSIQIEVNANTTVQESWKDNEVIFTSSRTITIPTSLSDNFNFNWVTLDGVTITWVITPPHTWLFGTPSNPTEKTYGRLLKRGNTNSILML